MSSASLLIRGNPWGMEVNKAMIEGLFQSRAGQFFLATFAIAIVIALVIP